MSMTGKNPRISRFITVASWLTHRAYVMTARPMAGLALLTVLAFIAIYAVKLFQHQDTASIPDEVKAYLGTMLFASFITYVGAKLTHHAARFDRLSPGPPRPRSAKLAAAARFIPEACWLFALVAYQIHPEPPLLIPINYALATGLIAAIPISIYLVVRPPKPDPFPSRKQPARSDPEF